MRVAMLGVKAVPTIGGIARYVEEVGSRLAERGHEVTVYCRPHFMNGNGPYRGMERITVRGVRGKYLDAISHTMASIVHAARQDFDVLHFHGVGPAMLAPIASPSRRHTRVVTAHGPDWAAPKWGRFAKGFLRASARVAVRSAAGWVAVSESLARACADLTGSRPVVIPSGTNRTETPPPQEILDLGLEPGGFVFCAGRLTPEKGLHYLIEAFSRLETDKQLVVAGSCPHRSRYVDELKRMANGQVSFVGYVEGRLLDELFGHACLYCQASDTEGLPLSVLEAMAQGQCVLASDIEGHLEALDGHGYTFRAGNVDDLTSKLRMLFGASDEVRRVGREAREYVRSCRTWEQTTDRYEELYEHLVATRPAEAGTRRPTVCAVDPPSAT